MSVAAKLETNVGNGEL